MLMFLQVGMFAWTKFNIIWHKARLQPVVHVEQYDEENKNINTYMSTIGLK